MLAIWLADRAGKARLMTKDNVYSLRRSDDLIEGRSRDPLPS